MMYNPQHLPPAVDLWHIFLFIYFDQMSPLVFIAGVKKKKNIIVWGQSWVKDKMLELTRHSCRQRDAGDGFPLSLNWPPINRWVWQLEPSLSVRAEAGFKDLPPHPHPRPNPSTPLPLFLEKRKLPGDRVPTADAGGHAWQGRVAAGEMWGPCLCFPPHTHTQLLRPPRASVTTGGGQI